MKVVVIGASGTVGSAVVETLKQAQHEVISVSLNAKNHKVDIASTESIEKMYQSISSIDAIVATIGKVKFAPVTEFTEDLYMFGLQNKLMGQVNLVSIGMRYLNKGGSFTLTSGILNQDPIPMGSSAAMVNGALDAFVKAAAMELPHQMRINIVSPTVLTESLPVYEKFFPGYRSVSAKEVAQAYHKSVDGLQTGQVYPVGYSRVFA